MLYAVRYENTFSNKKEEHQYQKALSRRLLSHGLQKEYGAALETLKLSRGPHGKPYFTDFPVKFSLSHCPGLVCCGVGEAALGVDTERVRPHSPRLAQRVCTPAEREFLTGAENQDEALTVLWTLKESLMKLTGQGMRYGFQNAAFTFQKEKPLPVLPGIRAAWFCPDGKYVVSVCCEGEPPLGIEWVDLSQLS